MCGIAGLFGRWREPELRRHLRRMLDAVAHRGPDGEGLEISGVRASPDWSVALGHRRLAIIDLSAAGLQPMASTGGRTSIIFNGEIYNYLELRDELRGAGYEFRTDTDTEVLLAAYARWGMRGLSRCNGMWAFALWDRERDMLVLARDRIGVKPLYYARTANGWLFASEAKALFATGEIAARYRPQAIEAYLAHGLSSFDEETFFEGVRHVPPGCYVELRADAALALTRYWDLPEEDDGAPAPSADEVRATFEDSVALRLRSDVPVGISLSGGVDSSAIACSLARSPTVRARVKTYSTFTVTYPGQPYDEAGWADDVVKQTGAQPIFVDVLANTDIDADLRAVIAACDEPVHSPSVFNLLTLMRAVRAAGVTVMLGGQGADEMFWGYPWTYAYSLAHWLRRGPRARVLKELAAVLSRGNSAPKYVAAYLAYQSLFTLRYHRGAARAKPFLAPASAAAGDREYIRSRTALLPYRALHRRDVLSTNLQPLLRYEDRISMRFGIEARLPFCDYRMAELAHRCRPEDLLHDGWSKYIFRTAMAGVVPDPVLWRREKRGFAAPVEDLLARAHGLRDEAADEMPRLAEVVDVPRARAAVGDPRVPWQIRWRLVNLAVGLACLRSGIHAQ